VRDGFDSLPERSSRLAEATATPFGRGWISRLSMDRNGWEADIEEPKFVSEAEMRTVLGTIMGRYSQIATYFDSNSDDFDPIF
jgi:hypothetical protein